VTEQATRRWTVTAVLAAGLGLSAVAWARMGASGEDFIVLLCWAAGGSMVAALLGALVLRSVRRRSIRTQASVIAAAAAVATAVGVLLAARSMFISTHDLGALLAVLSVSAAVGLGAAVQLGTQLDDGTRQVRDLARRIGTSAEAPAGVLPPAAPQFEALAEEVADVPRRLEELRRRADALERSRSELVAWVSHDLRSPLATIRAMAEALDDGVVGDEATRDRYHHQIRRDAERLSRLVDDLFELSRITSGVLDVRRDRVSLDEVVSDVLDAAQHRAEQAGVRLVDEVDDPVVVEVAVPELMRVLHNVIDNAIRHTPPGGEVAIRMSSAEGRAVLAVEDECGGIPEPDLERVFDVAFRGDSSRARGDQRGGLGLAIAKGLVEACSGTIEVGNASGGCCFTVHLPLSA
jgi:signal transduction histidine kinase